MNCQNNQLFPVQGNVFVVAVLLLLCLHSGMATGAGEIDPDADEILASMSSYLAGLQAFAVTGEIDLEVVDLDGQKLQLSSFSEMVVQRPNRFRATRTSAFSDAEIVYDGAALTIHGKRLGAYVQIDVGGSIDEAILALEIETGLDAPGADLLFADPYAVLSAGVNSSSYLGTAFVNGVECHHLAFREDKVDWQLWVRVGDEPLPVKYVITSKWQTAAPQYALRLRDWDVAPKIASETFAFPVPEGASELDAIPVNEFGDFDLTKEDM